MRPVLVEIKRRMFGDIDPFDGFCLDLWVDILQGTTVRVYLLRSGMQAWLKGRRGSAA